VIPLPRKTLDDLRPSSTLRRRQKGVQRPTDGFEQMTLDTSASLLKGKGKNRGDKSWAALGADTSMTACSVVGIGYDGTLDKMVGPGYAEVRWQPEDDYFKRLAEAVA
jgi:hypothetical protein